MDKKESLENLIKELVKEKHSKKLELMLQEGGCVCPCCLRGCH